MSDRGLVDRPPGSPPLPEPAWFTASDGYRLGYRVWRPAGTPRGTIVALHGIQSHAGWYGWSSARLAAAGCVVAFLDRRGSGVNAEARGDAPHADRLIHDVTQFAAELDRCGLPARPRALLGISWGGKLAAAVAARRPDLWDAVALLTPGLASPFDPNILQRMALRMAEPFGSGERTVPIPLSNPALFTDDPTSQAFIAADPLTLRRVTLRFLAASLRLGELVSDPAAALPMPALMMLAGRDGIIDNTRVRSRFTRLAGRDATVIEYPSARHTLEFEPDRDRMFDDLTGWLNRMPS